MTVQVARLDHVCEINPRMPKTLADDGVATFLPMAAVSEDGRIDFEEQRDVRHVKKGYTYFERGDVLVAKITPCFENGKATRTSTLSNSLGFGSTEFHVLRPGKDVDASYLFHLIWNSKFREVGAKNMTGSAGQKRVPVDFLRRLEIPLPPLDEQRRIAAILDKADTVRRKRKRTLELLDGLAQAIFWDMFGDPLENSYRNPVVAVGEVTSCIVPGRDKPKSFTGSIPWITTAELVLRGYTSADCSLSGLTDAEIATVRARVVPAQSVLMTCIGDLGVVSIAEVPMVINQQLHSFQCSDKIVPEYLMYALSYQTGYMFRRATQTTLPYMNKTVCNSIPVQLPPIEAQLQFGNRFKRIGDEIVKMRKCGDGLERLFLSLQQRAFSGQL
ncbi:MAG TPA: restriction endonuclease subunit S [Hyphomicrobium sp.]|nr:restriction endonuclease subunit S [Hyphomicrobium sp.]